MFKAAPDAIRDAKAAVRFLRTQATRLHLDEKRFAAWSNSAGGYPVAMLAATADRRTAFADVDASPSDAIQAAIIWFGAEDRLGRDLDPATYIRTAIHLPFVRIVNGDADPVVHASQARRLHEAFVRAGARSELVILPGAGHEDPEFSRTQMEPTLRFLSMAFHS